MARNAGKALAAAISEGLEEDEWGDIDPYIFKNIVDEPMSEWGDEEKSMHKILTKAIAKMTKPKPKPKSKGARKCQD